MPQADEYLRAQWPGGDQQAIEHLETKGFIPTRDFCWIKPYKTYHLTNRDNSALDYLVQEWDYGCIVERGIGLGGVEIETPDALTYQQPRLTAAEQYILGWLAEERAEVTKMAVGKTLRFGFRVPGRMKDGEPDFSSTPENELHDEVGDLLAAIELSFRYGVLQRSRVMAAKHAKIKKVLTENDNLGRPLAPPLPELPIRGPDGEIWEPADGDVERQEVIIRRRGEDDVLGIITVRMAEPAPKRKPFWQRLVDWRMRSKKTDTDLLDFG